MPGLHMVMHGSSSVPQDLQDIINAYGGKMPQTWGVPVEEIQRGIKHGVRKINIDTDNRMAITGQIRKVFAEHPGEFDPRKYLKPATDAMTKICRQRLEEFNTAGQASKIKQGLHARRDGQALCFGRAGPEIGLSPGFRKCDRAAACRGPFVLTGPALSLSFRFRPKKAPSSAGPGHRGRK